MFTVQKIEDWTDLKNFGSIAEILRHYNNFNADTLYDYFTRQKLSEVEYKGYRILKRELIKSKRSKNSC